MMRKNIKTLLLISIAAMLSFAAGAQNHAPNPYQLVDGWGKPPEGRKWGTSAGIFVTTEGNIWITDRCGGFHCKGKEDDDTVFLLDKNGNIIRSFGAGLFVNPHGIFVDNDGNVWVTDGMGDGKKGHQVHKFTPEGELLMSLGIAGVGGLGNRVFNAPTDVLVAPDGSIFVSDGHFGYGMESKEPNDRIVKFDSNGNYLKEWGKTGTGPGEFIEIHAIAMDADGRLFAADRRNRRIQIFDQEGTLLDIWTQFGMPSDIFIDADNILYCTDSESARPDEKEGYKGFPNTGWVKGIRIGSAGDGMVTAFIPNESTEVKGSSGGEGVAADSEGNVYTVGVKPMGISKYEKKQ
jgi:sugar lactone lactonase YvrE